MSAAGGLTEAIVELARIAAPTFAEEARLEWVASRIEGLPGERARDGTGNLVWHWSEGRPRVLLLVHLDTVFPAGTELATRVDGGDLVGPGVGDNAAAVVVAIDVVGRLLAGGVAFAPGAVAFTVGEEGLGNLRGATATCRALAPEAVLALEGHGLEHVIVDAVGSVRARVEVAGPGGHSWVDRARPSAIHALVPLANELLAHSADETPVNVGLVSGGRSVNTIADRAELIVEMRSLAPGPLDAFAEVLGRLAVEAPLSIRVELLGRRPAGRLDRGEPLLAAVSDVRAELRLLDELAAGSTDANAAFGLGIPALTLGVARGSGMHTLEERIELASLELGRRQLEAVLRRLLA